MKINPNLLNDKPTHKVFRQGIDDKPILVKSLKVIITNQGRCHSLEIMEGPNLGKWTSALEKELEKL